MAAPVRPEAHRRASPRAGSRFLSVVARLAPAFIAAPVLSTISPLACTTDPVQQILVNDLGDENPDVEEGEYHRAGDACLLCHQENGKAKSDFSVAGTIFYAAPGGKFLEGVGNVEVRITASNGDSRVVKTNCVGNFYIGRTQSYDIEGQPGPKFWDPLFPLKVSISNGAVTQDMKSLIGRDGSCAGCHRIPRDLDSAGHVYLAASGTLPELPKNCPVNHVITRDSTDNTQGR